MAAGAAIAAAGVVVWQSWETRRAANSAAQASAAAVEGLDVARESARISSDSLEVTRQLAAEAVRTRIDAGMPALNVTVTGDTDTQGFLSRSVTVGYTDVTWASAPAGTEFALPRDAGVLLCARGTAVVENASSRTVELHCTYMWQGRRDRERLTIDPGNTGAFAFQVWRSVHEWVEGRGAGFMSLGGTTYGTDLAVVYEDPSDTGANEGWELVVEGSPLEEVPGLQGAFRIPDGRPDVTFRMVRRRDYFLSKSRNQPLD